MGAAQLKPARIPLFGSLTSRDDTNTATYGASQKDQYFEDCSFQIIDNAVSGKKSVWVSGRNDFDVSAVPSGASGNGTAIRYWRGHSSPSTSHILTAFGSTNSTIYDGNTSLGAITGVCIFISETAINAVANAVFVSNGNRAYFFEEGGSLTEITDADFPPKQTSPLTITGNFVHMDGIPFIMTTNGQIWHGDINTLINWKSTSSISAQESPDPGVGIIRYKSYIYALGRNSGEFFQNTGNAAGSVLSRVKDATHTVGCISNRAIIEFNDTVIWAGGSSSPGIYMLDGFRPKKISTEEIDFFLEGVTYNEVRLNVVTSWGQSYVALNITSSGAGTRNQLIYDPRTGFWHLWTLTDALTQSDCPGTAASGMFYVGPDEVTYLSTSNSVASGTVVTHGIDFNTRRRKLLKLLRVVGDKATSSSTIAVSWSDDDGQTWNTDRNVDMAENNPTLQRCGVFRRRQFRLTGIGEAASDRRQRVEAIELEYEVLSE